jgi:hypothetical protein
METLQALAVRGQSKRPTADGREHCVVAPICHFDLTACIIACPNLLLRFLAKRNKSMPQDSGCELDQRSASALRIPCFSSGIAWKVCASHQAVHLSHRALRCRTNL